MKVLHKITYIFSLCSFPLFGSLAPQEATLKSLTNLGAYSLENELLSNNIKKKHKKYIIYKGQLKTISQQIAVNTTYEYYQSNTVKNIQQRSPLVIIFTGVGGISFVERKIARFFVHREVSAVITEFKNFNNIKTISSFSKTIKESLLSSLGILEYFYNKPEIDTEKIATIGISLGGFRALYLSSLDKRIKATTLVVTGSSLSESIASSKLSLAKRIRHLHMGSLETQSHASYINELKKHLNLHFVKHRVRDHYYLFMAKTDKTVPYNQQQDLWHKLGEPKFYISKGNHIVGILYYICTGLKSTFNFFKQRWDIDAGTNKTKYSGCQ